MRYRTKKIVRATILTAVLLNGGEALSNEYKRFQNSETADQIAPYSPEKAGDLRKEADNNEHQRNVSLGWAALELVGLASATSEIKKADHEAVIHETYAVK
jgi:hypothetical protein